MKPKILLFSTILFGLMGQAMPGGGPQIPQGFEESPDHDVRSPGYERGRIVLFGGGVDFEQPDMDLHEINERWQFERATPLFPASQVSAQGIDAIRARYPNRAARSRDDQPLPDLSRILVLEIHPDADVGQAAKDYAAHPGIDWAMPDLEMQAFLTPNDEYYNPGQMWGAFQIGTSAAWDLATGDGIVVAVIDSGVDTGHADLAANIWVNPGEIPGNSVDDDANGFVDDVSGWDFVQDDANPNDTSGHGTHVAGIIAAVGDNTDGTVGIAFNAEIMPLRSLFVTSGSTTDVAAAMWYAVNNGADVVNLSLGGPGPNPLYDDVIQVGHALGMVWVAAAGNAADEVYGISPANNDRTITVAAYDNADDPASYSNFGETIDVAAPGGFGGAAGSLTPASDILSTVSTSSFLEFVGHPALTGGDGETYLVLAGTSMATPHVSGLVALMLEQYSFTNEEIRQRLRQNAVDVSAPGFDLASGFGRIDAASTLAGSFFADPVAQILAPYNSEFVPGPAFVPPSAVPVDGFATVGFSSTFGSWQLSIGEGELPVSWTTFASGTGPVFGGTLGTLNTLDYRDGRHTLRLRTTDLGGGQSFDRNMITIDNVFISNPVDGQTVGGFYGVGGRAAGNTGFGNYTLSWAPGCPVEAAFTTFHTSSIPVGAGASTGNLGFWELTPVPEGKTTLRLTVNYIDGDEEIDDVCVNVDKKLAGGFPQPILQFPTFKSPKFANIDGITNEEIVVGTSVYRTNGALLPGWDNDPGLGRTNPAIANLDGGDDLEIIAAVFTSWECCSVADPNFGAPVVTAYRSDKSVIWQYPVNNLASAADENHGTPSSISMGDVDGDGELEVVFSMYYLYENTTSAQETWIYVLDSATGGLEQSFSVEGRSFSSIALADLDGDDVDELVFDTLLVGSNVGRIYATEADGTLLPGWPVTPPSPWGQGQIDPVIADIDLDGSPEILVGESLLHADGTIVAGSWPLSSLNRSTGALAPMDDGECLFEVAGSGAFAAVSRFFEDDATYAGLSLDSVTNMVINMSGENNTQANTVIADIDGDGAPEVLRPPEHGQTDEGVLLPIYGREWDSGAGLDAPGFPRWVWNPSGAGWGDRVRSTPAIGDPDHDGLTNMAIAVGSQLFYWELGTTYNFYQNHWPMFQHDLLNSGFRPVAPLGPEVCDGVDNDCDGLVDEHATIEHCDGVDNDCDGLVDEGFDSDGDLVADICDICPHIPNPDQDQVHFLDSLRPAGPDIFDWASPEPVEWVRGELRFDGQYLVNGGGTTPPGQGQIDTSQDVPPFPGTGFFYLVRYAGPCGSWETEAGAQPLREALLP